MGAAVSESSSSPASAAPAAPCGPGVPFTLYALRDRVYASNVKGKLVDLGALARDGAGTWAYLLDGDKTAGSGFDTPEEALAHVASMVTFLFLDGQFTALEDLGGADRPDLADAPQCAFTLDPRGAQ